MCNRIKNLTDSNQLDCINGNQHIVALCLDFLLR